MTTESRSTGRLTRPAGPMSTTTALALRAHHRLRTIPRRNMVALVVASVVGFATFSIVSAAQDERSRWGDSLLVTVATDNLSPGTVVDATNTEIRSIPIALLPAAPVVASPSGRVASGFVVAGQILSESHLVEDRHGVDPETRVVTLPHPIAPPQLVAGDYVDLIGVQAGDSFVSARVIAQASIVEIGEAGITAVVDRRSVGSVFEALASGSIEYARRPAER